MDAGLDSKLCFISKSNYKYFSMIIKKCTPKNGHYKKNKKFDFLKVETIIK